MHERIKRKKGDRNSGLKKTLYCIQLLRFGQIIPINSGELTESITLFPLLYRAKAREILQYVNNSLKKMELRPPLQQL